jgi:hypothetical protein
MQNFWQICESKEFTDAGLQKYVKRKKLSAKRSELTVVWLKTRVARSYSKVTCRHLRFLRYSLAATAFSGGVYLAASGDCNRVIISQVMMIVKVNLRRGLWPGRESGRPEAIMARADDEAIGGQPFYPEGSAEFRCREISQTHSWSRQAEPVVWVSLNRLASIPVVLDVKAHGLEDAFLGCLNRFAETVNTGKIVAISEVSLFPRVRP